MAQALSSSTRQVWRFRVGAPRRDRGWPVSRCGAELREEQDAENSDGFGVHFVRTSGRWASAWLRDILRILFRFGRDHFFICAA